MWRDTLNCLDNSRTDWTTPQTVCWRQRLMLEAWPTKCANNLHGCPLFAVEVQTEFHSVSWRLMEVASKAHLQHRCWPPGSNKRDCGSWTILTSSLELPPGAFSRLVWVLGCRPSRCLISIGNVGQPF